MGNWVIDKVHSTIGFEVAHMMVSKVRGEFHSFSAKIVADDVTDLSDAEITFTIDADSIDTRYVERDNHLRSADFFDVEHYPDIDFKSTRITKKSQADHYEVEGDLTMKEVTKSVKFDVVFRGKAIDSSGTKIYGFEAEGLLNREDYGLLWNQILETGGVLVGQEITIKVGLEIQKANSSTAEFVNVEKDSRNDGQVSSDHFHQLITENLTDLVVLIDQNGAIKHVTPSLHKMLGYDVASFERCNFFDIVHPDDRPAIKQQIVSYAKRTIKSNFNTEFRLAHQAGSFVDVDADIINTSDHDLIQIVTRDISEQKEAEQAIYHLAFYDSLTNLPNRRSFLQRLRNKIMERKDALTMHSILFIDLDDFKPINDKWGHDAGDHALKEVAKRINAAIRPTDLAARYGGDEFVVLLTDVADEQETITRVEKLFDIFNDPIGKLHQTDSLTLSVGVAHYPAHGRTCEELIKNADTALHYVKERGKNDYLIFDEKMKHHSLERLILENALRHAITKEQFYMVYQPKVNISTNEIIGMEALVRWKHPELGIISPAKFIPLAEETGLIVPLGEWILRESSRQAAIWQDGDYPPLNLSVNISVLQLEDVNFISKVETILQETGLDPKRLEFEITESVLANVESTVAILKEIRQLGVLISVDDFGTGYSSLSYIKDLPIDTIKIDQSFVKDIHTNKESKEIVKALINLANSIGLNAIAEGIEQKEHVAELMEDGYTLGQGYYYSRPLEPRAFEDFMSHPTDGS